MTAKPENVKTYKTVGVLLNWTGVFYAIGLSRIFLFPQIIFQQYFEKSEPEHVEHACLNIVHNLVENNIRYNKTNNISIGFDDSGFQCDTEWGWSKRT